MTFLTTERRCDSYEQDARPKGAMHLASFPWNRLMVSPGCDSSPFSVFTHRMPGRRMPCASCYFYQKEAKKTYERTAFSSFPARSPAASSDQPEYVFPGVAHGLAGDHLLT